MKMSDDDTKRYTFLPFLVWPLLRIHCSCRGLKYRVRQKQWTNYK